MNERELMVRIDEAIASVPSCDGLLREAVRIIKDARDCYNWVGIYLLEGDTLVLHNYIGKPTEHTHISVGNGVCGTAVLERQNQIVGDVTKRDNYLACSIETRAEIVVLIRRGEQILGQIDIDSDQEDVFGHEDERLLNLIADRLAIVI